MKHKMKVMEGILRIIGILIFILSWVLFENSLLDAIMIMITTIIATHFSNQYIFEKKRIIRWRNISQRVEQKFNKFGSGFLGTMKHYCNVPIGTTNMKGDDSLDIVERISEKLQQKDLRLHKTYKTYIFHENSQNLFKDYQSEIRYILQTFIEYLDDQRISALMDIESSLERINMEIIIRNKFKGEQECSILSKSDEEVIRNIESHLRVIMENVIVLYKKGFIKYQ